MISLEELMNMKPSKWWQFVGRMQRLVNSPRRFKNKIKWFIQRGKRGWSDEDAWNSYNYLAKIIGEQLEWLAENKHGVGHPYYKESDDVNVSWEIQRKDYHEKAKMFKELYINDIAFNKEFQDKWGGISEEEYNDLMDWFKNNFLSMWD